MKTYRLFIAATLVLAILLSACAPVTETIQPIPTAGDTQPYPVDETQEPGQAYPIEGSPTQPESGDVSGGLAYITDPIAARTICKTRLRTSTEFALIFTENWAGRWQPDLFPYSIYQAFMMVYAGADVETKAEICPGVGY